MTDEEEQFVAVLVSATIEALRKRVASGALLPEGKTAPKIRAASVTPAADIHAIDDVPPIKTHPLAACVTTRDHSGTAEPHKIYGKRGAEASLDGGPVQM